MDTDLSHEAIERFEHLEEHISDIENRLDALEGAGTQDEPDVFLTPEEEAANEEVTT